MDARRRGLALWIHGGVGGGSVLGGCLHPGAGRRPKARLWSDAQCQASAAPTPNARAFLTIRPIPTHYNRPGSTPSRAEPWFQQFVADSSWKFALVEIAPLIAPQVQIMVAAQRRTVRGSLGSPPDRWGRCLNFVPSSRKDSRPTSASSYSRDKGLVISSARSERLHDDGRALGDDLPADGAFTGGRLTRWAPSFGTRVPTVQVARVNGRLLPAQRLPPGLLQSVAGARTHVPCVVLDFDTPDGRRDRPRYPRLQP